MSKGIETLRRAYELVKESFVEMILKFALAAEYHDPATGTHLIRIADYTTILAQGLNLNSKEIENLRYASCMHDIGKIGIPEHILQKKERLTEQELSLIKRHPLIGARIFEGAKSQFLKIAYQVTLFHHERYDGKGYPFGFKEEEIPIYARIVSLTDVFDALTSTRPYREPLEFNEAVEFVKRGKSTHFDPHLVLIFLKNLDKIQKIWSANITISRFLEECKDKIEEF